jgi:hypothetical protein
VHLDLADDGEVFELPSAGEAALGDMIDIFIRSNGLGEGGTAFVTASGSETIAQSDGGAVDSVELGVGVLMRVYCTGSENDKYWLGALFSQMI